MPLTNSSGQEATDIQFGNTPANMATLNGTVIWQRQAAARAFTLADADISFSVSQAGLVSLSINRGALVSTNFSNGQNLGTVSSDTTRTLTGSVRAPNDATLWSNANELITISGISDTQQATVVVPVDGTADWGSPEDTGSLMGGVETFTYGSFNAYSPARNSVAYGSSFTQTRSRTVMRSVTATFINRREQCELITSPSGGGSAGRCSNPDTAIGGYRSAGTRQVDAAITNQVVTGTVANGGVQENPTTGTLWDDSLATVRAGTLAVGATTGTVSGTPTVSTGVYTRHEWIGLNTNGEYDLIPAGGSSIQRTVNVFYNAPSNAGSGSDSSGVMTVQVTQASSGLSELTFADLGATCNSLDGSALTAAQIAARIRTDHQGTVSVTSGGITANPSTTTARNVQISISWTGFVPTGFIDEGSQVTLTGSLTCSQSPSTVSNTAPTLANRSVVEFGDGSIVEPADGDSMVTYPAGSGDYTVTAPTFAGTPTPTVTVLANGAGTYSAPTGRGRSHRWQAENSQGTFVYNFTVVDTS